VEQVVLPYTGMVTAAIGAVEEFRARLDAEGGPAAAASAAELLPLHQQLLSSLHSALALLAVATYKIRVLRPALRDGRLVQAALAVRSVAAHVPCLASLLTLTVNADVLLKVAGGHTAAPGGGVTSPGGGRRKVFGVPHAAAATGVSVNHGLRALLVSAVEELAPEERARLLRRLRTADPSSSPTATNGTSWDLLKDICWPHGVGGAADAGAGSAGGGEGKDGDAASGSSAAAAAAAPAATPVCALSGRLITDVCVLVVPSSSPLADAPAARAPGALVKRRGGGGGGGGGEGKGEGGGEAELLLYCERAAAEEYTEMPALEGAEPTERIEELPRDDPVLLAVQRGQLARMIGAQ